MNQVTGTGASATRDVLGLVVRVALLLAVAVFVAHTIWSARRELDRDAREMSRDEREIARDMHAAEREQLAVAKPGPITYRASTSAVAAQITLTNLLDNVTRYACVRGVVERKGSSKTTETVEVCSGDLKPHSTVTLIAPYTVGAVEEMCSTTKQTYFGDRKELDWDLCNFDISKVETVATPLPVANKAL
jgi:hypothetical protein